jgi:GxxExxY protein
MMVALHEAGVRAEEEVRIQAHFHGVVIGTFHVDIIVDGAVLIEIKALPEIDNRAIGQLLNYLNVAGGGVGLLLNFGRRPEFSRKIVGDVDKLRP